MVLDLAMQSKIDEAAIMWNKTKNPKYKKLWYELIRKWCNGPNNIERRVVPIDTCHEKNVRGNIPSRSSWLNLL